MPGMIQIERGESPRASAVLTLYGGGAEGKEKEPGPDPGASPQGWGLGGGVERIGGPLGSKRIGGE